MRSENEHKNLEGETYRELRLLEEVNRTPDMSQRSLARRLGIALGVTNVLVRSMAKKGYIRIVRVRWRQWAYIVTPAGISRRIQLTFAYIDRFLDHYRRVRELLRENFNSLDLAPDSNIAIYGATEFAEMVFLVLRDLGVSNIDIVEKDPSRERFLGTEVQRLEDISASSYAKIVVAYPTQFEERCEELLCHGVLPSQIVTLLHSYETGLTSEDRRERSA